MTARIMATPVRCDECGCPMDGGSGRWETANGYPYCSRRSGRGRTVADPRPHRVDGHADPADWAAAQKEAGRG